MICHNCLQTINPLTDPYRRIGPPPGHNSKPIYIHWPHCPENADPLAHHKRMVRKGLVKV